MVTIRQFRLVRFVHYYERFRTLTATAKAISVISGPLLGVAFCYFYSYGFLGVQILGGYICVQNANATLEEREPCMHEVDWDPETDDYSANDYYALNFNDLLGAIVTLFVLTVSNNYDSLVSGFVRATGTKWTRLYFAVGFAIGVVVLVNVTVSFVIDAYVQSWHKKGKGRQDPGSPGRPGSPPLGVRLQRKPPFLTQGMGRGVVVLDSKAGT